MATGSYSNNIKNYKASIDDKVFELIDGLNHNGVYVLNPGISASNDEILFNNILEKYIFDNTVFLCKDNDIQFDMKKNIIEFSIINSLDNFVIEYDKKNNQYPLLSSILYLGDDNNPLIFTNIDIDTYKYKEFDDNNHIIISFPEKYKQIVFTSSYFYGCLDLKLNKSKYIKINIWDKESRSIISPNYFSLNLGFESLPMLEPIKYENDFISDEIALLQFFDKLFFDDIDNCFALLTNKYNNYFKDITTIGNNQYVIFKVVNNSEQQLIIDKYGDLSNELLPFFDDKIPVLECNRFHRNKLLNNGLSTEVCYWIMNECEKSNSWKDSPYPNYNTYISIDNIPHVLNLLLFLSNFWIMQVKKLFSVDIQLNIKEIFVVKYIPGQKDVKKYKDDSFLTFNILLNSNSEFVGGDIMFENNDDSIKLSQGDLLIYNGKKYRSKGDVSEGIKYVLVLFLQIC